MAVSLLPQKKRKKQFAISKDLIKENKSVVFAGSVLLAVVIAHFAISIYAVSLDRKITRLSVEAQNIQKQRDVKIEDEVIKLNSKFSTVENLLDNQVFTSKLFTFIESITHPSVYLIDFAFRANDKTVTANGSTENYRTFGEQYIAFEQNKDVRDVMVSSVKLSKTGKVEFGISFSVDESIYKP